MRFNGIGIGICIVQPAPQVAAHTVEGLRV
jgi:hypothetical protein